MKRNTKSLLLFVLCIALMAACGSKASSTEADDKWAKDNKIFETETVDELYEKAKEEGKVVVYAKGSKFKNVKTSFEEEYPGIKVESYKISRAELVEKLTREHESGVYNADVVHTDKEPKLVDGGHIYPYSPDDIMGAYFDDYKDTEYPIHYMTINPIIYNSDIYDEPPVENWWDLTEPEWEGKVLIQDPVSDLTYSELFITMIKNSDEMAKAYEDKYGEDIELTEENAGYEFIKRFLENDPVLMSAGEDIIESVAQSDEDNPHIGFSSSSKLRHIEQSGLPIEGSFELNPRVSVIGASTLYVADQAQHPNAAKLLIRWAMGEDDGEAEGLVPFNLYGVWVPRENVENKNDISIEDINAWDLDQEFYDLNFSEFRNFWISNTN